MWVAAAWANNSGALPIDPASTGWAPTTVVGPRSGAFTRHSDIDANRRPLPWPAYCPAKSSNFPGSPLVASANVAAEATDDWTVGTVAVKTEPMSRVRRLSSR